MHEGGGLQRLTTFAGEMPSRQPFELGVDGRHQLFERVAIAIGPRDEQLCDAWREVTGHLVHDRPEGESRRF